MAEVTCGQVRELLSSIEAGRAGSPTDPAWAALSDHGAVEGSPTDPRLTAVGHHVLAELTVRASRTDPLTLDSFAAQLTRVLGDLDQVAKTAEYFLAELGPVTPPEAVPLLRPVAVGLANRRETPEELAEEFRNAWGSVEVIGGDARDRLLAAELLNASDLPMESSYSKLMSTTMRIREVHGERESAVAAAAILLLHSPDTDPLSLAGFTELRRSGLPAEEAALLATLSPDAATTLDRQRTMRARLVAAGLPEASTSFAASFLTLRGADVGAHVERIRALVPGLTPHLPDPVTPAAILSAIDWLEPSELLDWVWKAREVAHRRTLAPTDSELTALGLALVHGLPRGEFSTEGGVAPSPLAVTAGLVALHAWLYRPLARANSSIGSPATLSAG